MDKSQHTAAYRRLTAALRRAREAAGLTQADVAAKLGAYASFVSKVESGERRVDVVELAALCRACGTDLVALLRVAEIT
ncbi:helix-turn-helix domain-containing protein [Gemmata sp.]|uniref:helix-turn-helix domain-containing protein n=1 Tax=Gemmata sp. TaxID=1914242 RepID=UPI003F6F69A8